MARVDNERSAANREWAPTRRQPRSGLGAHEAYAFWQGMRDQARTLGTSFIAGFMEDIFGIKARPYFRDPRLEAIRRLTICIRQGLPDQLAIELLTARRAGVTENQIAALRARIGQSPSASG